GDNVTTLPNPLPSIKPVKVMTGGEEWINTIIECMDDAGFTVTSGDGYHHLSYNGSNGGDFAMYKCQMKYPLFNGTQYLPRVRAEQLYYYQVNGLKPCLENLGYVVSNPPTLEQYLEASYNAVDLSDDYPGFDPMAEVENFLQGQMLNDLNNSTDSEKVEKEHYAKLRKVYDRCPALPADFWPELPEF
ncbi:MAG: hypothetical protein LBC43_01835, partial [Bifidobacteriaceae bacterium]|nr:hypothetical protein [Bifidobacteriaceae bacterium]